MNEGQLKPNNLVDTTDCLEAVGVFRCWKNFLFVVILICIVLLQACFWVADTGFIRAANGSEESTAGVEQQAETIEPEESDNQPEQQVVTESESEEVSAPVITGSEEITEAARQVAGDANEASAEGEEESEGRVRIALIRPTANQLAGAIRFLNFVIVPVAIVYCLTMLFSLKISLVGRLGGINHIARAFFLSLIMLVLLLPWQMLFAVTKGAIFTPAELMGGTWDACREANIFGAILYYLRFVGYWILIVLLLFMAQARNARWARTILRRLEVI